jgi:glycosyltransferase involved in cell wall biosynthesis
VRIVTVPISLKHLIRGQASFFQQQGYEVILVSADGPELDAVRSIESVPHVVIPFSRKITLFRDLYCLYILIKFLKKEKPDIVHTQTPKAGLLGMIAAGICKVPRRIHTVGGLPIMTSKGLRKFILRITETVTAHFAHQVLANSHKMAEYMVDEGLCHPSKLYVLGRGSSNGIDTSYFHENEVEQSRAQLRAQHDIPTGAFVFLFIGRLVRDKGVGEIVEAFEKIARNNPQAWLLLVGPSEEKLDPLKSATWRIIHSHERIIQPGYQNDVRPWIKMSDLLLFPSYREGFPNVPLQAASMQVPAIVSNINGCNEIVTQGYNGWIVEPGNSIGLQSIMEHLLLNPLELKSAASVAREIVEENYSQHFIWNQLAELYRKDEIVSLFTGPRLRPIVGGKFNNDQAQPKVG